MKAADEWSWDDLIEHVPASDRSVQESRAASTVTAGTGNHSV